MSGFTFPRLPSPRGKDPQEAFKRKGWLWKEGTFFIKKRWFVLSPSEGKIFFASSETSLRALGVLIVKGAVVDITTHKSRPHAFRVRTLDDQNITLFADSAHERNDWMYAIQGLSSTLADRNPAAAAAIAVNVSRSIDDTHAKSPSPSRIARAHHMSRPRPMSATFTQGMLERSHAVFEQALERRGSQQKSTDVTSRTNGLVEQREFMLRSFEDSDSGEGGIESKQPVKGHRVNQRPVHPEKSNSVTTRSATMRPSSRKLRNVKTKTKKTRKKSRAPVEPPQEPPKEDPRPASPKPSSPKPTSPKPTSSKPTSPKPTARAPSLPMASSDSSASKRPVRPLTEVPIRASTLRAGKSQDELVSPRPTRAAPSPPGTMRARASTLTMGARRARPGADREMDERARRIATAKAALLGEIQEEREKERTEMPAMPVRKGGSLRRRMPKGLSSELLDVPKPETSEEREDRLVKKRALDIQRRMFNAAVTESTKRKMVADDGTVIYDPSVDALDKPKRKESGRWPSVDLDEHVATPVEIEAKPPTDALLRTGVQTGSHLSDSAAMTDSVSTSEARTKLMVMGDDSADSVQSRSLSEDPSSGSGVLGGMFQHPAFPKPPALPPTPNRSRSNTQKAPTTEDSSDSSDLDEDERSYLRRANRPTTSSGQVKSLIAKFAQQESRLKNDI